MRTHDYFYVLTVPELGVLSFSVDFLWLEIEIVLKAVWKLKMRYLCNTVLHMAQQISMLYSNLSVCVNPEFLIAVQKDCRIGCR